jgi:hypothetical protein
MPVPSIALLAASLHEASAAGKDPASHARAVSLLARAVGGSALSIAIDGDGLLVNGIPVPTHAPGVPQVVDALTRLRLGGLTIPAQVEAPRWRDIVALLVGGPALYPDPAAFLAALLAIAPGASILPITVRPDTTASAPSQGRAESGDTWGGEAMLTLGTTDVDRAGMSLRLDPILERGRAAVDAHDDATLAEVLLELSSLDVSPADAVSVRAERRRLAPPRVLEAMARRLTEPTTPAVVAKALATFGAEAADAIVEVLRDAPHRAARRTYINALAEMPEAEATILAALTGSDAQVVVDVAEVAGRRMLFSAVPTLARLLKHHDEAVRAAAWRALEQLDSPDARRALAR